MIPRHQSSNWQHWAEREGQVGAEPDESKDSLTYLGQGAMVSSQSGLRRLGRAPDAHARDVRKEVCSEMRELVLGPAAHDSGRGIPSKDLEGLTL